MSGRITNVTHPDGSKSGKTWTTNCLLYTSDAADERSSVDLGGRRIIKKKKKKKKREKQIKKKNKKNKKKNKKQVQNGARVRIAYHGTKIMQINKRGRKKEHNKEEE